MHLSYFALFFSTLILVSALNCDASMKCDADGCAGLNVYDDSEGNRSKQGYCTTGDCAGKACTPVCPDTKQDPLKCDQ